MNITILAESVWVYTFNTTYDYSTNVYVIERENALFVIDTHCGPVSMNAVMANHDMTDKRVFVINTHYHWDHIWGNCYFEDAEIIAHEQCRRWIEIKWQEQLQSNSAYAEQGLQMKLPNCLLGKGSDEDVIEFPEEGIRIFSTPGHTGDCISVYDSLEDILIVGDNLEKPLVYVEDPDIDRYIKTIETYNEMDAGTITASHTTILTKDDVFGILGYLKDLRDGIDMMFDTAYEMTVHEMNLQCLKG